uniref:NADH dehydrogenase subunit 4 n=1 Tax=Rheocricotopus emeiensis TaxID=3095014 RepID=UPI002E75C2A6|nr:NADH dehydrogenase subunit 4 [Rheocricotopus emeiensis]WPM93096.1 NADH dehydrogenase subunit 4 [Rheocricotopus emeiensis]
MLKILFFMSFTIPLCFMKNMFWMVQNMLFFVCFIMFMFLKYDFFFVNFSGLMGMDLVSYGLIILSVWICALMIMASESVFKLNNYSNYFLFLVLFLLLMLFLTFSTYNLFLFYLYFESSLIPTLFLILGWGYQPERIQAGMYLLFYTLLASLPLLLTIFYIYSYSFTLNIFMLMNYSFLNNLFYFAMIFAFLVKMPMFLVHLWLPKAHVEAPVSGSMILAGVLLKLGGYGLLRVFPFLLLTNSFMNFWFISISLTGGVIISLICLRQVDMKALIAYSSVAHMGIVLSGLMTLTYWGLSGSYTLMIAHGLCSSGLFCLANLSYERLSSRSLLINKGLLNFMPSLSLWWFLLCAGNMAAPPTLNLLGEISLLNSIIGWSWLTMILVAFLSFFSAAYSLYLYSMSQQGSIYSALYSFSMNYVREYLVLFLHWFSLNILILKSDLCLLWL